MKTKARDVLELISTEGLVRLAHHLGVRWIWIVPVNWCRATRWRPMLINRILMETKRRVLSSRLEGQDMGPLGLRRPVK